MWVRSRGKWRSARNGGALMEDDILQNDREEVFMFTRGEIIPLRCDYEESLGEPTAENLENLRVLHQ